MAQHSGIHPVPVHGQHAQEHLNLYALLEVHAAQAAGLRTARAGLDQAVPLIAREADGEGKFQDAPSGWRAGGKERKGGPSFYPH